MRGRNQNEKNAVRTKEVFVGVDVHKEADRSQFEGKRKKFFMGGWPVTIASFGGFWIVLPGVK